MNHFQTFFKNYNILTKCVVNVIENIQNTWLMILSRPVANNIPNLFARRYQIYISNCLVMRSSSCPS